MTRWSPDIAVRLLFKIRVLDAYPGVPLATPCWEWCGSRFPTGYGQFSKAHDSNRLAHREAVRLLDPDRYDASLQLDHLCRHRWCVNPDHLEPVTAAENTKRGDVGRYHREKSHCANGHPFTQENTYPGRKPGWRRCRRCTLDSNQKETRYAG